MRSSPARIAPSSLTSELEFPSFLTVSERFCVNEPVTLFSPFRIASSTSLPTTSVTSSDSVTFVPTASAVI